MTCTSATVSYDVQVRINDEPVATMPRQHAAGHERLPVSISLRRGLKPGDRVTVVLIPTTGTTCVVEADSKFAVREVRQF